MKKLCILMLFCVGIIQLTYSQTPKYYSVSTDNGAGYRFWGGNNSFNIALGTGSSYQYGPVTDYSIKFNMNNDANRGWTWGIYGSQPIAALTTRGTMQLAEDLKVLGNVGIGKVNPAYTLDVYGDINFSGQLRRNGSPLSFDSPWLSQTEGLLYYAGNVGIGGGTYNELLRDLTIWKTVSTGISEAGIRLVSQSRQSSNSSRYEHHWDLLNTNGELIVAYDKVDLGGGDLFANDNAVLNTEDAPQLETVTNFSKNGISAKKFFSLGNTNYYIDPGDANNSMEIAGRSFFEQTIAIGDFSNYPGHQYSSLLIYEDGPVLTLDNKNNSVHESVISFDNNGDTKSKILFDYTTSKLTFQNNGNNAFSIRSDGNAEVSKILRFESNNDNPLVFNNTDNGYQYISFNSNNSRKAWMGINTSNELWLSCSTGKVGIEGTDIYIVGEDFKVNNGRVYAREVNVTLSDFPDYVFSKNYNLKSLKEVEEFINQEGHLPEVPSASEVEDEGVNIGEMNTLLLKKIEELTLHLIQQEKRITALENENAALKSDIK